MNRFNSFHPMQTSFRYRPLLLQLRAMMWLVIASQLVYPYAGQISAQEPPRPVSPNIAAVPGFPPPVLTPTHVVVNRTIPQVTPPAKELRFSANPTDNEFFHARVFAEPIVSMGT